MTNAQDNVPQAEPAHPEPSEDRLARCACCGGTREPDPTDDNLRLLRRMANLGMDILEDTAERVRPYLTAPRSYGIHKSF